MSLSDEQKNKNEVIVTLPSLVQTGPIPGDPDVLDPILFDGVDVENPEENVIGIVFNTKEDERKFFSMFEGVRDGVREKMKGTPLMIETEKGSEEFEELFVLYNFMSEREHVHNDVVAFVGDKYPEVSLDSRWVKSLVYQEDLDPLGDALLEKFLRELLHE